MSNVVVPPYGQRHGFKPRKPEQFGDGGAFPEILIAQFPLGMGKKGAQASQQKKDIVSIQFNESGNVKYDALLRQGHHDDMVIHSSYKDLVPVDVSTDDDMRKLPSEDEIAKQTEETKNALLKIVDGKVASDRATHVELTNRDATFIRYTPANTYQGITPKQRIIRMVESQSDPMEPPKFKTNKKIPRGPPSPPVPVLHSPQRKVTAEEQRNWSIPPCISNWKNHKGFTVPLDKRMAADGRGLQDVTINDNFAKVAEALYIAERESRESILMRNDIKRRAAQKEKERKEEAMRKMAEKAREERVNVRDAARGKKEDEEVTEREQIRRDRERERRRQRNIKNAAYDKRTKLQRDDERDVTERIALGLSAPVAKGVSYDSRLFGQSQGLSSGFSHEDQYSVYDKPMRGTQASSIYRPTRTKEVNADEEYERIRTTDRFRADKGFSGTEASTGRSGPVQFEKGDDFGVSDFLSGGSSSSKRRSDRKDDEGSKRHK
eukprot:m.135423 g.135423  ORF g.135423 m.135423 type:complete len:492 (+) comp9996_c0_seq1:68-1543(+)